MILYSNGQLKIARPPEHGALWLGSKRMKTGSVIPGLLSGELEEKLIYQHDGSLTKKDSFELLVSPFFANDNKSDICF